jgi:hypothetical protein
MDSSHRPAFTCLNYTGFTGIRFEPLTGEQHPMEGDE